MKRVVFSLCGLALAAGLFLNPSPAHADDEPALLDGGSIVTTTDGGSRVTVDLGTRAQAWSMAIRCEGQQSTRYRLCTVGEYVDAGSSCVVSAANLLLDYDVTQDIEVNEEPGRPPKRYLSLATDDAGIPYCKVYR